MASFANVDQSLDRPGESPAGSRALNEKEGMALQEGAANSACERQRFLVNSLGKSVSPSTEVLKDMVVRFFDGGKDRAEWLESAACEDPRVAGAHLKELARDAITNPAELARFEENMQKFETRVAEGPLLADEIAATYRQVGRLFQASDNPALPDVTTADRIQLAKEIMAQAATPTNINQGCHNTCNVTSVETRTYTRNPSAAARLVADIATTGVYRTAGDPQVEVHVDPSRIPDQSSDENVDEARSHASQIFQVTAVNVHYTIENNFSDPPGKIVYEQVVPEAGATPPDDGERLWNRSTDPPTEIARNPKLDDDHIVQISNQITGQNESDVLIVHKDNCWGEGKLVTKIDSEASFNATLERLRQEGKLPVIVGVGSGNEPFLTDSGGGAAGGSAGPHVVTITSYRPGPPALVEVDNQWGPSADHLGNRALSMHDLYLATRASNDPRTIADLQKDVESARTRNALDAFKEFELLRLKRVAEIAKLKGAKSEGTMTEDEILEANRKSAAKFDAGLAKQIAAAAKRWSKGGELYEGEREKAVQKMDSILKALPADERFATLGAIRDSHMLSSNEYEDRLVSAFIDTRERWVKEDARPAEHPERHAASKRAHDERARAMPKMDELFKDLPAEQRKAVAARVLQKK